MFSTIRVMATDLDGTLLNNQLELSRLSCSALQRVKAKGIRIVLCTGRPFKGMEHLIPQIGLDDDDYTITYNGSLIQSCDGKRVLHRAEIAKADFLQISRYFARYDLGLHAMTIDRIYTYNRHIHPLTVRESYLGNLPISVLSEDEIPKRTIIKLMAVGEPKQLDEAVAGFSSLFGNRFSINKSEAFYLEIMQKGDNKGAALALLLEELSMGQENLMAFGNNLNDLEMVKLARIGVAVENAVKELKDESDYITKTNDQDGVAVFLDNFCA